MNNLTAAIAAANDWLIRIRREPPLDAYELAVLNDPQRLELALCDTVTGLELLGLPDELRGDLVAALLDAAIAAGVEGIES